MIRSCEFDDCNEILRVINDAAGAYRGVIPDDCMHDPYMSDDELKSEIGNGVRFYCCERKGELVGVMGIQDREDVTLIRHAYVETKSRRKGVGGIVLGFLKMMTESPILIGTWKDAFWAIDFYKKHGYRLVTHEEKEYLLRRYWTIPERQIETSVVLEDGKRRGYRI